MEVYCVSLNISTSNLDYQFAQVSFLKRLKFIVNV